MDRASAISLALDRPSRHIAGAMEMIDGIEWRVSPGLTAYADSLTEMEARAAAVRAGTASELVWLLEHPPLFTAGTSADPSELFNPMELPVFEAGRGGRYTYHGPGQRVVYLVLDLDKYGRDIRRFVNRIEWWMIIALGELGVRAHRLPGRIGIWVGDGPDEAKIGALGVRVKRWVTLHGFSINVAPQLDHFSGIVPCGISEFGVASLESLGKPIAMNDVDHVLKRIFSTFLNGLKEPCKES